MRLSAPALHTDTGGWIALGDLLIVMPVYNEANSIARNVGRLLDVLREDRITARIALVDDGSADASWAALCALSEEYSEVTALRLSRNFGKEAAICAALECLDADLYLVMDSDLQHPPACIKDMLALMDETGADIIDGVKTSRGREGLLRRAASKGFYRLMRAVSGLDFDNSSDFKLMRRRVVDALRQLGEGGVFFRGLTDWVGFVHAEFPFSVAEREDGSSRFSARKLIALAFSAMLSHTSKPLYLTTGVGLVFLVLASVLGVQSLYMYFSGRAQDGFSTVILLLLLTGSLILLSLGVIGAYIARIYNEVKARPRYIVSDRK